MRKSKKKKKKTTMQHTGMLRVGCGEKRDERMSKRQLNFQDHAYICLLGRI